MIVGIVLAAGSSRRMGTPKLTLPWKDGGTIVEAVVAALRGGGVRHILVVVGADHEVVESALAASEVEFVENPRPAEGDMLESIRVGLRAAGEGPSAALLTPGDLPAIQPATVRALIQAWEASDNAMCAPVHDGRRGHPVLLPRWAWAGVLALGPGESLRTYLRQHRDGIVNVQVVDAGIHADIDTPQDYDGSQRQGGV